LQHAVQIGKQKAHIAVGLEYEQQHFSSVMYRRWDSAVKLVTTMKMMDEKDVTDWMNTMGWMEVELHTNWISRLPNPQ